MPPEPKTPGPWLTLYRSYRGGPDDEPYGLTEADARRADLAPEMVEVLEMCVGYYDAAGFGSDDPLASRARTLLARARGEEGSGG